MQGVDCSEIGGVTAHTYAERKPLFNVFADAINSFLQNNLFSLDFISNHYLNIFLKFILGLLYILLFLFACSDMSYCLIFLFIVLPYFFIWAFLCSYDLRNIAFIYPFYGLGLGLGIEKILLFREEYLLKQIRKIKFYFLILLFILGICFLNIKYTKNYLLKKQAYLGLKLGDYLVNKKIFDYDSSVGISKTVLTDQYFEVVELLKNIPKKHFPCFIKSMRWGLSDEKVFDLYLQGIKDAEIGYLFLPMIPGKTYDTISKHILDNIEANNFKLIFSENNRYFIKIINKDGCLKMSV